MLTGFIFLIRFPWNDLLEKAFRDFHRKSPQAVQMEFDKLKLKIFPPGVEFKDLSFFYKGEPISLDSLIVSMDLAKWLAFKKGWKFKFFKEGSYLSFTFHKTKKRKKRRRKILLP